MANHGALFNTMDVRDWTKPQLENSKEFTNNWPATNFPLGINWLDYDRSSNIRLKSYIDNVKFDEKNLTFSSKCHLDACTSSFDPNITCWFTAIDLDKDKDWRIDVSASDVTKKAARSSSGCGAAPRLLAQGVLDRAPIRSLAHRLGSFNTMDQRPWDKPQHEAPEEGDILEEVRPTAPGVLRAQPDRRDEQGQPAAEDVSQGRDGAGHGRAHRLVARHGDVLGGVPVDRVPEVLRGTLTEKEVGLE
ncbi:Zinc-dependent metalloprotease [Rhizoctonia solani]|uniref:Zinc-dependent metalloprotease n=1 Tax=Rhizoctonia solani TaxID=456999 RepID=A0A8H7I8D6_9AGAM|nr:Zinc-dependent metalloprotease [Rhizoctonia solani]